MQNKGYTTREEFTEVGEVSEVEDLAIDDLEGKDAPFNWICVTSSTCKCTSTSCAAWQV